MIRWSRLILILTGTLGVGILQSFAAQPEARNPACSDPQFEHWRYSPRELREIAYNCDSPAAVRLFLNRADYLQLWERWGHLAEIDGTGDVGRQLVSYRLFIGLLESFAREMPQPSPGWQVTLNAGYERGRAFDEQVLRGYAASRTH